MERVAQPGAEAGAAETGGDADPILLRDTFQSRQGGGDLDDRIGRLAPETGEAAMLAVAEKAVFRAG